MKLKKRIVVITRVDGGMGALSVERFSPTRSGPKSRS
jgi:hypothetical protein